ncbi:uncharacterized protein METZ01_LOCUS392424 [marine metagenome]|uniref:Uncharacterized protein n=1 Tax=marine metagenome TaxID=408172 RepID=A0A382UZE5_9ZZZZ
MYSKIVIKFPWISNFDLKLGGWDLMFKIPMSAFVFLIFILGISKIFQAQRWPQAFSS